MPRNLLTDPAGSFAAGARVGALQRAGQARARDERDRELQRQMNLRKMAMELVQADPDINLERMLIGADAGTLNFGKEMQKSIKRRTAKTGRQEVLSGGNPGLEALGPALAFGNPQERAGAGQGLGALTAALPENVRSAVGQRVQAMLAEQTVGRREGVEAAAEQAGAVAQSSGAVSQRFQSEEQAIEAAGRAMAGGSNRSLVIDELTDAFPGQSEKVAAIIERADVFALGEKVRINQTSHGMTDKQANQRALFETIQEATGGLVVAPSGEKRQLLPRDANLIMNEQAFFHQFSTGDGDGYVVMSDDPKRVKNEIAALESMLAQFDRVEESFAAVSEKVKSGEVLSVGKGRPEILQDWARFMGEQDADVATYQASYFLAIASLLKAIQGSRPSDFDFKNFLSVGPTIQEFGTDGGVARLKVLRDLSNDQIRARLSPAQRRRVMAVKSKSRSQATSADRIVNKAYAEWQGVVKQEGGATANEELEATVKLMNAVEEWKAAGGGTAWAPDGFEDAEKLSPSESLLMEGL